jgi:hypothetical protein
MEIKTSNLTVMKKVIIGMAAILLMSVQTVLADDVTVNATIKKSFDKEFPGAESVRWQKSGELYLASFFYKGQRLTSFFEESGDLYSVTRYVSFSALPINVIKNISSRYSDGTIDDTVMEVAKPGGTSYLVTIKSNTSTYIVEADAAGTIYVVKKQKQS